MIAAKDRPGSIFRRMPDLNPGDPSRSTILPEKVRGEQIALAQMAKSFFFIGKRRAFLGCKKEEDTFRGWRAPLVDSSRKARPSVAQSRDGQFVSTSSPARFAAGGRFIF